jgi:ATP-dependent Clp protease adaptor protein ClpS
VADDTPRTTGDVREKTASRTRDPDQWRVLLLNDDYTPMDFVVEILESIFGRQPAEAYRVMMQVHTSGSGLAGVYPHELAETKVVQVVEFARQAGYPLQATMERA